MKEEWLLPGAVVPVDVETTAALVAEIKRLIGVVDDLKLSRQLWIELTAEDIGYEAKEIYGSSHWDDIKFARAIEAKLREKNA